MATYFEGMTLIEHDTDPESRDHKIVPGSWREATCAESDAVHADQDLMVWSYLTDTEGEFGDPIIFTQWGSRDETRPAVANVRFPGSQKRCVHRIFVPA